MPDSARETATLKVNGDELAGWKRYDLDSSLLNAADAFSFEIGPVAGPDAGRVHPGDEVQVLVDGVVQMSGYVDDVTVESVKGQSRLEVVGRDRAGHLVDCSAPLLRENNVTLAELARRLGDPWVTSWQVANDVNRRAITFRGPTFAGAFVYMGDHTLTVSEPRVLRYVRTDPGETRWTMLERHAKKEEKLAWLAADGTGVVAAPHYDQAPRYRLLHFPPGSARAGENNVLRSTVRRSLAERFSQVTVFGTRGAAWDDDGGARFKTTATDPELTARGVFRPLSIFDPDVHTLKQAEARAHREIQLGRLKGKILEYEVPGHGQGDQLWAIDTTVEIDDQVSGVQGEFYVAGRQFTKDRQDGTRTKLTLVEKGVLLP